MKLYTSINELQTQAKTWMQYSYTELNNVKPSEIVNFYVAASYLINKRLAELSNALSISGLKETEIISFSPYSSHRHTLACCDPFSGKITVAFKTMITYESLDMILIHELCHLIYRGHGSKFWTLFESNLKKLGYISSEYDGWNPRFDKNNETWNNDYAYNVEHTKFKGSCNRRIAILKYKIFKNSYFNGRSIFCNDIYSSIKECCNTYGLTPNLYSLRHYEFVLRGFFKFPL